MERHFSSRSRFALQFSKVCRISADCIANIIRGGLTGARKIFSEGDL